MKRGALFAGLLVVVIGIVATLVLWRPRADPFEHYAERGVVGGMRSETGHRS